ncbi:MAG: hypothetical protein RMJ19_10910 [Gemmatales bacterium]|nr:hypothetical protein [Gemmatales bacterium]MCS7160969.1 hypothetical protein [Gemmatales bacterium]MDW8176172.1 hypothetical protein [Gemmatales bacterium]MDW8223426.1 hypothetical protein [Gemmatales bacterium]
MTSLVKKLDSAAASDKSIKACVVFLSDDPDLEKRLQAFIEKEGIKNVHIGIDNPAGPKGWNIAKDADVTAVFYTKNKVVANHAVAKGGLDAKAVEAIIADISKLK